MFTKHDRITLSNLAKQVTAIAVISIQVERREVWKQHNTLTQLQSMILIFPEEAWVDLKQQDAMECEEKSAEK